MRRENPEHIGTIINQLLRGRGWEKRLQACRLVFGWEKVVGPQIAKQAQAEYFKDGVLHVRVENSVWLNHLRFLSEELRQKLNREIPSEEIKEIRFHQGSLRASKLPSPPCRTRPKRPTAAAGPGLSSLSPEQQALLAKIRDPDLRRTLESLLKKQLDHSHR